MEKFVAILLLFVLPAVLVCGQEGDREMVSLDSLVRETGAEMRWDPFRTVGEISKNNNIVVFKPGFQALLINYSMLVGNVSVERDSGGGILVSANGAEYIRDLFTPEALSEELMNIKAIVLDPGHGGKDPGAIGNFNINGEDVRIQEKDIVLKAALLTAELLKEKYPDKEIVLTRATDEFPTLEQRTEIANNIELGENEAIIFVSIHANASLNPGANGFEVWYLPPEYRRDLLDPSTLDSDLSDVAPILNTMLEEEITVESILLAKSIQENIKDTVGDVIADRGLKEESWFVVRNAKMPAVLIELGFVTNESEALILNNGDYLKKISEGIYNGIRGFINHFESLNLSLE